MTRIRRLYEPCMFCKSREKVYGYNWKKSGIFIDICNSCSNKYFKKETFTHFILTTKVLIEDEGFNYHANTLIELDEPWVGKEIHKY